MIKKPYTMAILLIAIFFTLVGIGVSGSSMGLGLKDMDDLIESNPIKLLGKERPIRSDEWLILTPMSIAQSMHEPRYPIVNKNIGPDGQNMLIVGMTGVPISHISTIAKPATWGFFIFDLRRALAWSWWFPIFGALFALWGVMQILIPGKWGIGLSTSAIFILSGYVTAWSYWPAYTVLFPAATFFLFFQIFNEKSWKLQIAMGLALGISFAGFVFILYPPWQVSLGYLFLLMTFVIFYRDKLWEKFTTTRTISILTGIITTLFILLTWFNDAQHAIHAIQSTVYPGQRSTILGGNIAIWELFKGFINHHTMYYETLAGSNQSEAASFLYLYPIAIFLMISNLIKRITPSLLEVVLVLFCFWILFFQLIGVNLFISEISQWGRVSENRADLALGLASTILCAIILNSKRTSSILSEKKVIILSLSWTFLLFLITLKIPNAVTGNLNFSTWLWMLSFAFLTSYYFLKKMEKAFIITSLLAGVLITLKFNPLIITPSRINLSAEVLPKIKNMRILVLNSQIEAMELLSAGLPIANGVFYYPQKTIWKNLDPEDKFKNITNRYQHLLYIPDNNLINDSYIIESPQPDVINIRINIKTFNFKLTGADIVIAPTKVDLSINSQLSLIKIGKKLNIYQIL
ncbi:MAG: hypothetical protein J0M15_07815 [Deltaproteobacteria bacterium]|nr:hypothetical protein [Deltaproteobacteria bacterium]